LGLKSDLESERRVSTAEAMVSNNKTLQLQH